MKSKKRLLVVVLVTTLLFACGATPSQASDRPNSDPACPTGVSIYPVTISNPGDAVGSLGSVVAFIIRPNVGCSLPSQYCTYAAAGYGGGLSCVSIP